MPTTGLVGGAIVEITQFLPLTNYNFRCVAVGLGGSTVGSAAGMRSGEALPDMPGEPRFRDIGLSSVTVIPPLRVNAPLFDQTRLILQARLLQLGSAWVDITPQIPWGTETPVTGLSQGLTYSFRYVAANAGGRTAGPIDDVQLLAPTISWNAGSTVRSAGIRWPQVGATLARGARAKVSAFIATDWDFRMVTLGNSTGSKIERFSDPCTYTWTCSTSCFQNGGGFDLNGVRVQTIRAQSPTWIAPNLSGSHTLTLVVDDQNNVNQTPGEEGSREDAGVGFNDNPSRFSVSVSVP